MQHFRGEIRLEAPIEHVWAVYCDTTQWEELQPGTRFSDFSGPIDQVGTTFVQSNRFLGHEFTVTVTVVEVEPLRLYHEHSDHGPHDTYFRFEPDDDATRVVVEMDHEMPGRVPGFIQDFMLRGRIEREIDAVLASFKALAEANVPAHA
jgi:uncharacterized membrane protein